MKETFWYKVLKGVGLGVIGTIAAAVSYYHMMHQIQTETHEWWYFSFILPLVPDGAILLGSLQIRTIRKSALKGWQRWRKNANAYSLLISGLVGSGWANLNSSGFASPIRIFWAIFPVLVLFLAIESVLSMLPKSVVSTQTRRTSATQPKQTKGLTPAQKAARTRAANRAEAASIAKAEQVLNG